MIFNVIKSTVCLAQYHITRAVSSTLNVNLSLFCHKKNLRIMDSKCCKYRHVLSESPSKFQCSMNISYHKTVGMYDTPNFVSINGHEFHPIFQSSIHPSMVKLVELIHKKWVLLGKPTTYGGIKYQPYDTNAPSHLTLTKPKSQLQKNTAFTPSILSIHGPSWQVMWHGLNVEV